jgi:hypothetical protein
LQVTWFTFGLLNDTISILQVIQWQRRWEY